MDIKFLVPTILSIIFICFTIIGIKKLSLPLENQSEKDIKQIVIICGWGIV